MQHDHPLTVDDAHMAGLLAQIHAHKALGPSVVPCLALPAGGDADESAVLRSEVAEYG